MTDRDLKCPCCGKLECSSGGPTWRKCVEAIDGSIVEIEALEKRVAKLEKARDVAYKVGHDDGMRSAGLLLGKHEKVCDKCDDLAELQTIFRRAGE